MTGDTMNTYKVSVRVAKSGGIAESDPCVLSMDAITCHFSFASLVPVHLPTKRYLPCPRHQSHCADACINSTNERERMSWSKLIAVNAVFVVLGGCASAFAPADPRTYNGPYMQMLTSTGKFKAQWNLPDEATCANYVKLLSTFDILGRTNAFCTMLGNPNTTHASSLLHPQYGEMVLEFIGLDDCNKFTADGPKEGMKVVKFCRAK
jgi:hypothetical protein